jgi:hypothetical protein
MIFSLFETPKPCHKVQLKTPNNVVIGSRTSLECAFQIGNFMNMLYKNIENESKTMTNRVVGHNLKSQIEEMVGYCQKTTNDSATNSFYLFHKEQIMSMIDSLICEMNIIKKTNENHKKYTNKEINELIELMVKSSYAKYNQIVNEIVLTFSDYFNFIK